MARFRRWGKADESDADTVDLSEDQHAWWASGRVQSAPGLGPEPTVGSPDTSAAPLEDPAPWVYTDVFAADVDGAIDREFGDADGNGDEDRGAGGRDLAEVFAEESAYRTLGLEPDATWDDVVTAHRRLAKRHHPDRLVGADEHLRAEGEQLMIEANAAYETLRRRLRPHSRTSGLFSTG